MKFKIGQITDDITILPYPDDLTVNTFGLIAAGGTTIGCALVAEFYFTARTSDQYLLASTDVPYPQNILIRAATRSAVFGNINVHILFTGLDVTGFVHIDIGTWLFVSFYAILRYFFDFSVSAALSPMEPERFLPEYLFARNIP